MKKLFLIAAGLCLLFSCQKIETFDCTCNYTPVAGVKGLTPKSETFKVRGRGYERASANCQTDYMLKYVRDYYKRGECLIK